MRDERSPETKELHERVRRAYAERKRKLSPPHTCWQSFALDCCWFCPLIKPGKAYDEKVKADCEEGRREHFLNQEIVAAGWKELPFDLVMPRRLFYKMNDNQEKIFLVSFSKHVICYEGTHGPTGCWGEMWVSPSSVPVITGFAKAGGQGAEESASATAMQRELI